MHSLVPAGNEIPPARLNHAARSQQIRRALRPRNGNIMVEEKENYRRVERRRREEMIMIYRCGAKYPLRARTWRSFFTAVISIER